VVAEKIQEKIPAKPRLRTRAGPIVKVFLAGVL
jgi:hypothetical protein